MKFPIVSILLVGVVIVVFASRQPARPPQRVFEVSLAQTKPSSPYTEMVYADLRAERTANSTKLDAYLRQLPERLLRSAEQEADYAATKALRAHVFSADALPRSKVERPAITIIYLGDDYGYPVEAVGIYTGGKDMDAGWKVLAARAPASEVGISYFADRPRARGYALALAATARKLEEPTASWTEIIQSLPIEWVTTNTADCPAALEILRSARGNDWFTPKPEPKPVPSNVEIILQPPIMWLHPDRTLVSIGGEMHRGPPFKGSASGWGAELIDALIPCFERASEPAPWRG